EVTVHGRCEPGLAGFRRGFEQFLGSHRAKLSQRGRVALAEIGRELDARLLYFRQRRGGERAEYRAAFADRACDQVLRQRRGHLRADRDGTGGFARNRHALRVASEGRDVLLYPLERRMLIEQGVIARGALRRLLRQLWMREESEHAQAI